MYTLFAENILVSNTNEYKNIKIKFLEKKIKPFFI